MLELGQLEKNHEAFAKRGVRIYAIANDSVADAGKVQGYFPHLTIVSDAEQNIANAMKVIDPNAGPEQSATNVPATFLVDGAGNIRWLYHADRFTDRLSPAQLLNIINEAP